jgi:hypothetical protein
MSFGYFSSTPKYFDIIQIVEVNFTKEKKADYGSV